ncbi:MAG: molecular chaperone DnaK, partial [Zetaproteobacteria bacterium]
QIFTTAADNQTAVTIKVAQGEREKFDENRLLGVFNLEGIPPAPRGVPQIEVTFDIDANGILHVTAKDKGTGKEASIRIEANSGLTPEEIERMRREAEQHAEEDRRFRELVEARNRADHLLYSTEKSLKEFGDKLDAATKSAIEQAMNNLREKMKGESVEEIRRAEEQLAQAAQKLGELIYQKAQQAGGQSAAGGGTQGGASGGAKGGDDVVDAEIVDEGK